MVRQDVSNVEKQLSKLRDELNRHNYFYYVVEGATLEICREDGTLNTVTMQPGDVVGGVEGSTHDAKNIDDKRFRNVLVEVKTS